MDFIYNMIIMKEKMFDFCTSGSNSRMLLENISSFRFKKTLYITYKYIRPLENVNIIQHEGSYVRLLSSR